VEFDFPGKSGVRQSRQLRDRHVARVVRALLKHPSREVFKYQNGDGQFVNITRQHINNYIREIMGESFSAKDFRTWAGTVLAARALYEAGPAANETEAKKKVAEAVKRVAHDLGNRPAASRKYYIHPAVIDAYVDGSLFPTMQQGQEQESAYAGLGLKPEEYAVMVIVARHQQELAKQAA
jgi:DNA topoisomerase-1